MQKKVLIVKNQYFKIILEVKTEAESITSKSRRNHYLLNKYEAPQCGDIRKVIN